MTTEFKFEPLISIIVPAYNVERYIENCILSIVKQSYTNIEMLVINDGSLDKTPQIINKLALMDNRILPIHRQNMGVSTARNVGIKASKGEYIVFVDGDDYLASDYVEYMIELIKITGGELCLSLNSFTRAGEKQVQDEIVDVLDPIKATALLLSPRIIVGSWNKIYKKSILLDNDLEFLTTLFYGEGLFFYTTFSQLCSKVGVGNRKVYYYRRNNYDSATTKFNIKKLINGDLAIEEIRRNLRFESPIIYTMLDLHKCLFSMGAVVRIKANCKEEEFRQEYKEFKAYLCKNTLKIIFERDVPIYRKLLLIGTCFFPALMAWLDSLRRKYITSVSVE